MGAHPRSAGRGDRGALTAQIGGREQVVDGGAPASVYPIGDGGEIGSATVDVRVEELAADPDVGPGEIGGTVQTGQYRQQFRVPVVQLITDRDHRLPPADLGAQPEMKARWI
ncbi:hypothetical protein [Nocardia sp. NPDC046763]|uniref:hypothetical protein n=1 Tax=Nocardia sp. NPDC046763 TaxID=3155256 RepID=UPI0033D93801